MDNDDADKDDDDDKDDDNTERNYEDNGDDIDDDDVDDVDDVEDDDDVVVDIVDGQNDDDDETLNGRLPLEIGSGRHDTWAKTRFRRSPTFNFSTAENCFFRCFFGRKKSSDAFLVRICRR